MSVAGALIIVAFAITYSGWVLARGLELMSQAADRLTQAVAALSVSVDALIAKPAPPPDETAVTAAADAVDALKAKVDAAVAAQ